MAFLAGLASVFALLWVIGFLGDISRLRDMAFNARVAAAVMFVGIGLFHLARPDLLTYMVEGLLPYPLLIVYASGVLEIGLGLGLRYLPAQRFCGWGLLLLLLAMFPANIYVALKQLPPPGGLPAKPWYVWSRLAFQPLYMGWIWFAALHSPVQVRATIDS